MDRRSLRPPGSLEPLILRCAVERLPIPKMTGTTSHMHAASKQIKQARPVRSEMPHYLLSP